MEIFYRVYISQLIRFAGVSSHVADFYTRNKILKTKLLKQGYRYHKHLRTFPDSIDTTTTDLVSKFYLGLKILLKQCLSEMNFMVT